MDCSLVINKASHLTAEGNEVNLLCKYMLTTPGYILVLHVFGNAFQEDFPHHLPKD